MSRQTTRYVRHFAVAVTAGLLAQGAWADLTRDDQAYKWYFVGSDGSWDNLNNWRVSLSTEVSESDAVYTDYEDTNADLHTKGHNAPHTGSYNGNDSDTPEGVTRVGEGKYQWTLVDGDIIPEGGAKDISAYFIEGWTPKIGVYNGVTLNVRKIQKLQGGAGLKKFHVDATSKIVFNAYGGGTSNNDVYYYVASDEGVTWANNVVPVNGNYTAYYYLTGAGTVKYTSHAGITHSIKSCEATLSEEGEKKKISKKLLVKIGGSSKGTAVAADDIVVTLTKKDGTSVAANKVNAVSTAGNIGDFAIVTEDEGICLAYVDYADVDPTQTLTLTAESAETTVIRETTQDLTINVTGDCTLTAVAPVDLSSLIVNKAEGSESAKLTLAAAEGGSFRVANHTIGAGVTLDLATSTGIKMTTTTNNGSIRVSGGTVEAPVVINEDGAANTTIGAIAVADGAVAKIYATNGNKVYNVTGEGDGTGLVILSSGQNWGMANGTTIRNCKISIQDRDFWFERADALDATVDVELPQGRTLHLGNPGTAFTIGALSGGGAFAKDNANDTLTITMDRSESTYSGNFAGIPVTIVGKNVFTFAQGNRDLNTNVTIAEGATAKIANGDAIAYAADPAITIDVAGTLDCGNVRQTISSGNKAPNVILRDGGRVIGAGAANGQGFTCGFDAYSSFTIVVDGAAEIATPISITGDNQVITIAKAEEAEAAVLTLAGGLTGKATGKIALTEGTSLVAAGLADGKVISGVATMAVKAETSEGLTTYTLYAIAAKIGDTPYVTVQDAIDALKDGEVVTIVDLDAEIPEGYAKVTKGDTVTLRTKGDVYYVSGYMGTPASQSDAPVFVTAEDGVTTLLNGDVVIIGEKTTATQAWMASDFAAKTFKVETSFTLHSGTAAAILDEATVTVSEGAVLTLSTSGNNATKLGSVTLTGAVAVTTDLAADAIAGTCTITLADNKAIVIGTKAETVEIKAASDGYAIVVTDTTYTSTPVSTEIEWTDVTKDTPIADIVPADQAAVLTAAGITADTVAKWATEVKLETKPGVAIDLEAFALNCATVDKEDAKAAFKVTLTMTETGPVVTTAEGVVLNVTPVIYGASEVNGEYTKGTEGKHFFKAVIELPTAVAE